MAELHLHSPINLQSPVFRAQKQLHFHQGEFQTIHVISDNVLKEWRRWYPGEFRALAQKKIRNTGKSCSIKHGLTDSDINWLGTAHLA
jgi:hypothetical protein